VLRGGQLETQPTKLALPAKAPVLGGLNLGPGGLELVLCRFGQVTRLSQLALQRLRLAGGPAMGITRLAPFFPHDAASEQLQPRRRFGSFASSCCLGANYLEAWLDLRPEILEAEQILGQLGEPLARFLPPLLDATDLGGFLEKLATLGGRANDDVLDVVLVDDRVRVEGEARRGQQVDQVAAAHAAAVEEVVALAVALDAALDGHLVVVDW
jgi:hypothetical protein